VENSFPTQIFSPSPRADSFDQLHARFQKLQATTKS
jgi:hypothetical protein